MNKIIVVMIIILSAIVVGIIFLSLYFQDTEKQQYQGIYQAKVVLNDFLPNKSIFPKDILELKEDILIKLNNQPIHFDFEINYNQGYTGYKILVNESEIDPTFTYNDKIICWQNIPYRSYFNSQIELWMKDNVPELNGVQVVVLNDSKLCGE